MNKSYIYDVGDFTIDFSKIVYVSSRHDINNSNWSNFDVYFINGLKLTVYEQRQDFPCRMNRDDFISLWKSVRQ